MLTILGCILLGMLIGSAVRRRMRHAQEPIALGAFIGIFVGLAAFLVVGTWVFDYRERSRGREAIDRIEPGASGRDAYLREFHESGRSYFVLYRRDGSGIRGMRVPADDRTVIREVPGGDATVEALCTETMTADAWLWGARQKSECRYDIVVPTPARNAGAESPRP